MYEIPDTLQTDSISQAVRTINDDFTLATDYPELIIVTHTTEPRIHIQSSTEMYSLQQVKRLHECYEVFMGVTVLLTDE